MLTINLPERKYLENGLTSCCFFCWSYLFPGALAWLDGSDVSYSNWVNMPDAQAACGHILGHSGFQWEATANCSQKLNFICQFGIHSLTNECTTLNLSCIYSPYTVLYFCFLLRFWDIYCMRWTKCHIAMQLWSSYRDWRQLLWSKDNSLLPI